MPTRKTPAEAPPAEGWEVQLPQTGAAVVPTEEDEETILDRLRSMQGEERDRMKVKVYRKVVGGTGLEWCTDYTVPEWEEGDIARVRQEWGPGNYELRVVSMGKRGILLRDHFRIAPARVEPTPAAPPPQSSELADVVRMLAEGQQRILEAVSQRPDPTAQMQSTLALMASMREAMGLNAPPPPPPPATDPGAMLGQLVGAIKTLREVAAEVNPPEPPEVSSPLQMLPQIVDLVKVGMSQRQNPAPLPAPPVEPMPLPASLSDQQPADDGDPMNLFKLRAQLGEMIAMAARGEPAERGGEYAADNLPDELLPHLARADFFAFLLMVHGGCKAHEPWFRAARDHCIKLLSDPEPIKAGGTD